jgi:hypothetical protein
MTASVSTKTVHAYSNCRPIAAAQRVALSAPEYTELRETQGKWRRGDRFAGKQQVGPSTAYDCLFPAGY